MYLLSRRMFLAGCGAMVSYIYLERLSVAVRKYRVPVLDLPASFEGLTILHLTDLHDKEFGPHGDDLLRLISLQNFDLVALTGDLVQGEAPSLVPALDLVTGIRKVCKCPIYSVPGNHDWRLERGDEFNERLSKAGVTVLSNTAAALERGEDRLWLIGVDDPVTRRDRLELALDEADDDSPRLLLCHSPQLFDHAVRHEVDLMLSGHTHGGQFRLPFLGACYVPAMGFFPRYDYGLFRSGKSTLIVSAGLGESLIPVRLNVRPELSLITLVRFQGPQPSWMNSEA